MFSALGKDHFHLQAFSKYLVMVPRCSDHSRYDNYLCHENINSVLPDLWYYVGDEKYPFERHRASLSTTEEWGLRQEMDHFTSSTIGKSQTQLTPWARCKVWGQSVGWIRPKDWPYTLKPVCRVSAVGSSCNVWPVPALHAACTGLWLECKVNTGNEPHEVPMSAWPCMLALVCRVGLWAQSRLEPGATAQDQFGGVLHVVWSPNWLSVLCAVHILISAQRAAYSMHYLRSRAWTAHGVWGWWGVRTMCGTCTGSSMHSWSVGWIWPQSLDTGLDWHCRKYIPNMLCIGWGAAHAICSMQGWSGTCGLYLKPLLYKHSLKHLLLATVRNRKVGYTHLWSDLVQSFLY